MACRVLNHPLAAVKLTQLRDAATGTADFRRLLRELGALLAYEALRDCASHPVSVRTPLAVAEGAELVRPLVLVPILRAGLGLAEGITAIFPEAAVGHIGMYRNEVTLEPEHYFYKVPGHSADAEVLLVDPMLATGNSAVAAAQKLKQEGIRHLRLVCLVGCPQGVNRFESAHPDIPITLGAMDEKLDERSYILPGLGDAGDRYFGT